MYTLSQNSVYICTHYLEDMLASILGKCCLHCHLSPGGQSDSQVLFVGQMGTIYLVYIQVHWIWAVGEVGFYHS